MPWPKGRPRPQTREAIDKMIASWTPERRRRQAEVMTRVNKNGAPRPWSKPHRAKGLSAEHRAKIGYAFAGRRLSPAQCAQRKAAWTPELRDYFAALAAKRVWTPAMRANLGASKRGRPIVALRGARHYAWKGGVTPERQRARQALEYGLWRRAVMARDRFRCRRCGASPGKMVAHHVRAFARFPELRYDVANGMTLCRPCHRLVHRLREIPFVHADAPNNAMS
jgi:hypothetical protein